jgi:hypothetical protein
VPTKTNDEKRRDRIARLETELVQLHDSAWPKKKRIDVVETELAILRAADAEFRSKQNP